jgi:uncharacterized membrane protein YesL
MGAKVQKFKKVVERTLFICFVTILFFVAFYMVGIFAIEHTSLKWSIQNAILSGFISFAVFGGGILAIMGICTLWQKWQ